MVWTWPGDLEGREGEGGEGKGAMRWSVGKEKDKMVKGGGDGEETRHEGSKVEAKG